MSCTYACPMRSLGKPKKLAAGAVSAGMALTLLSAPSTAFESQPVSSPRAARFLPNPATWPNGRLAAQLVLAGITMNSTSQAVSWARSGIAGVVLFGSPPASLRAQLLQLRANAPGRRFIISSDEEGGAVQRLSSLIGRMPSAAEIGRTRTVAGTRALARLFGARMKRLGVNYNLAPVADLLYPGSYMARDGRAFKSNPVINGRYVKAFSLGLRDAGVAATVKHWPGGGAVADTHIGAGRTPSWGSMQRRDLVPFRTAFAGGVDSVMVGHPSVPGLTGGVPASQSRPAFIALRQQAGPNAVIMTDALAMAAVTSSMRQSQGQAAVRAIASGADLALVQGINPFTIVSKLAAAIRTGQIPRARAVASARRVLAAQERWR